MLAAPLAGNPSILNVKEFPSPVGDNLTAFIDSTGAIWLNDPETPTVNTMIAQVVAGLTAKFECAFNKLWCALYHPAISAAFSDSPFVGAGVPIYYNGQALSRVTSDAPGVTPIFSNIATVPNPLTGFTLGAGVVVNSASTTDYTHIVYDRHLLFYYAQVTYVCATPPPANWLGTNITVTGFTGSTASFFNGTVFVSQIVGNNFIVNKESLTFQASTGTGAAGGSASITYLQRSQNIVTAWIGGATLPSYFIPGFWTSLVNTDASLINGPNWTITSISRDTNGLVTVVISTGLTNLPVGAQLYINPSATALAGTVSVTNGNPTVAWVSGSTFINDMVGEAITINAVNYTVAAVNSPTSLTLQSNVTSTTGTYAYSASIAAFPAGFQTVFQVTNVTPTATTFTYESFDNTIASAAGGTVYQQWSPQLGQNGNAGQIISSGIDPNNGAFFTFFQLGPDTVLTVGQGNISSPYAQIQGQIAPGLRNAVLLFQSADGAITAPSQIVQIAVTGGSYLLQANNVPLGPAGTNARIFAFTPYNGSSWYYIQPAVLPAIGNSGETVVLGTFIEDNQTTAATIDFSDSQLTSATQIDATGNNLFNQFVLPPCLGVAEYAERLHWWGAINNVRNLENLGFDGGYMPPSGSVAVTNGSKTVTFSTGTNFTTGTPWNGSTIVIGGVSYTVASVTSSTVLLLTANYGGTTATVPYTLLNPYGTSPLGWNLNLLGGPAAPYLINSPLSPGFACVIPSQSSAISQPAFQDEFGAQIALPNTLYGFRVLGKADISGILTAALYSPSVGILAGASITIGTIAGWYYGAFTLSTPSLIPPDTQFIIQGNSLSTFTIDECELIYANQPVQNQTVWSSYIANPFGYDDLTGDIGIDAAESISAAFRQRGYFYILTDKDLHQTQANAQAEPAFWTVNQYAAACGCSGPNAVDGNEDVAFWSGRYGGRLFNGNPSTKKITQEIAADWENHNWDYATLDWVANDPVQRLVYFGYCQQGQTSVSAIEPMNYRLADDAYNVPDPVHTSQYSGKMIATDLGRKWSLWSPGMNGAAMCTRNGPNGFARQMVFAGSGFGNLYTLDVVNFPGLMDTDDDYGPIGGYYVTYFFPDHQTEQNPIVSSYRKFFGFQGAHLTGKGQAILTPYVDSISTPWPKFPPFNLTGDEPGFDYQLPLNVRGDRMAIKVGTQALNGSPGGCFVLTHLIFSCQKDASFPVRGSLL